MRVPFKGGGDAVNSMMTGTTPIAIFGIGNLIASSAGRQDPGHRRRRRQAFAARPRIPTFREIGYNDNLAQPFFGIYAPTGTPQPIIDKFRDGVAAIGNTGIPEAQSDPRALDRCSTRPSEFAKELETTARRGSRHGQGGPTCNRSDIASEFERKSNEGPS